MEDDFTISITDRAATHLLKSMELKGREDLGVRIHGSFSACCGIRYSLTLEENSTEDDIIKEVKGIKIFVNKYMANLLDGVVVDYIVGDKGAGFVINSSHSKCERGAC
jgi:iron-sulfur cluster assembly accessory protein